MEKMSEMSATIEELCNAAAAITEAADWLTQQFSGEAAPAAETQKPAKEPPKPALTLEQVRAMLAKKSRARHTAEIRALLAKHGAPKLSQIDPAECEALLKDAEDIRVPEKSSDFLGRGGAASATRTKAVITQPRALTHTRLPSTS